MKHLLAGLILTALGAWGIIVWWDVFGMVMRGVIPFLLMMLGLVALLAGLRTPKPKATSAEIGGTNGESGVAAGGSAP